MSLSFIDIGYGLSTVVYVMLFLLLLTSRQSGVTKKLLILAIIATILWSLSFVSLVNSDVTAYSLYIADTLKQMAWLLFLASCMRAEFTSVWSVIKRPETLIILSVPIAIIFIPFVVVLDIAWFSLLQTVLALEMLILLEIVYRQASEKQWEYKPLILFLGASQLYEFVLYANAIMVSEIDERFVNVRGFIYVLLAPLLVLAVRRIKNWGINIFVSREVVLHSSLLLVAAVYLLIMSMAGYAVSYFGGKWSTTIQVIMYSGSAVVLASVFLSNQIRTKIKTFITKHFFANQYDYREEWIKLTKILSEPIKDLNDVYHHALHALMSSVNYDQAMFLIVENDNCNLAAKTNTRNLSSEQIKLLYKLLTYCKKTHWFIDLNQYKFKPYEYPGLTLSKDEVYLFRFQLVLPIIQNDAVIGMVLLNAIEKEAVTLDWEVKDYLTAVTEQVSTYLSHHKAAKTLAENAQFAAFNRMSAFVLHDLKNVMAQIDLILANAQQHKHNPEFIEDTFETLEHTKTRMDKMLKQLTDKKIEQNSHTETTLLSELVSIVVNERCRSVLPMPSLELINETSLMLEKDKVTNVLYHLISNAQQATDDKGSVVVKVSLNTMSDSLLVSIIDTGEGMSEAFIQQRLFAPFDTTKGNAGMGIGVYDAKNYMESIGGKLTVKSKVGSGTTFTLIFPLSYKDNL